MPGIYSAAAATHAATYLISALKYPAPSTPFSPLGTENINSIIKLAEIFQLQITPKTKFDATETQTKIVEQKKNRTHKPLRVDPQSVTILAPQTPQTICKAKPGTHTPPHNIPFDENEYSSLRVEMDLVRPAPPNRFINTPQNIKMAKESEQRCGARYHCIPCPENTRGH